jgi:hypothetical protein
LVGVGQGPEILVAYCPPRIADNVQTFGDQVMIAADRLEYPNGSKLLLPADQLTAIGYWDSEQGRAMITADPEVLTGWCGEQPELEAHTYRYDLLRSRATASPAVKYWIDKELQR